jgi:hypothetical protein
LTLGSDGGIYQGSGTSGSPTTGLKIWNDSGTGRIAGYNSGTIQWYASTDGKQYFGAGKASLSADGLRFDGEYGAFGETGAIEWVIDSSAKLSIGVDDSELPIQSFVEAAGNLRLTASMVIVDGQLQIPIVAAASASNQTLYEDDSDGALYYKDSGGTAHKLT